MLFIEETIFIPKRYEKKDLVVAVEEKPSKGIDFPQIDFILPNFSLVFVIGKLLWHVGVPFLFLMSGFVILTTQIIVPKLSKGASTTFIKPLAGDVLAATSQNQVLTGIEGFEFTELKRYKEEHEIISDTNYPANFTITIPKLGIKDFLVETNSVNLRPDAQMGHYKGSCLPGETCKGRSDSFIYGHSALPAFYDPTDPKKVFSKLDDLEPGDKFFVNYNGKDLVYRVNFKKIMEPSELDPLNPPTPFSIGKPTMTLMTCTPAGTTKYRLVVSGELL